jgi:hypothetical protein
MGVLRDIGNPTIALLELFCLQRRYKAYDRVSGTDPVL